MATRVLTQPQSNRIAKALTALCVTLNQMGFPWPDDAQADIKAAFGALGEELPFEFVTVPLDAPAPVEPAGTLQ